MKQRIKLAAVAVAFLAVTAAHAAPTEEIHPSDKSKVEMDNYYATCERDNRDLNRIFNDNEQGEIGANFQAGCVLGLHDGYAHNKEGRKEQLDQLNAAVDASNKNNGSSYGDMLAMAMATKYLRAYDFAEALAKKDGN